MQTEKIDFHLHWLIGSALFIWVSLDFIWNSGV